MKKLLLALLAIASFAVVSDVSATCPTRCAKRTRRCEQPACEKKTCKKEVPTCIVKKCVPACEKQKIVKWYECPADCEPGENAHLLGEVNGVETARSSSKRVVRSMPQEQMLN